MLQTDAHANPHRSGFNLFCVAFLVPFLACLWQIIDADSGADLLSPMLFSDAALFHYSAWFKATLPISSYVSEIIALSPYESILTTAIAVFGFSNEMPFVLNAIFLGLASGFVALTTNTLFGRGAAYWSVLLVSLNAPLLFFAGLSLKTTWIVFLLSLLNFCVIRYLYSNKLQWLALFTFVALLAAIDRIHVLIVPMTAVLVLMIPYLNRSVPSTRNHGAVLIVSLFAFAYGLSVMQFGSEPKYLSSVGMNVYLGHSAPDNFNLKVKGVRNSMIGHRVDGRRVAERSIGHAVSQAESSRYWLQQTWEYIRTHPREYVRGQVQKLHHLFSKTTYSVVAERLDVWRYSRLPLAGAVVDFGIIMALFLVGVWSLKTRLRDNPATTYLVLAGTLYLFSLMLTLVLERYRVGFMVFSIPIAAWLCSEFLSQLSSRYRELLMVIGLIMVSLGLAWSAPSGFKGRVHEYRVDELNAKLRSQRLYQTRASIDAEGLSYRLCLDLVRDLKRSKYRWDVRRVQSLCRRIQ